MPAVFFNSARMQPQGKRQASGCVVHTLWEPRKAHRRGTLQTATQRGRAMHANDPVNRIMTEPVLTITPSESLEEALRLFTSYPVHHLPVVEEGRVVGMLSSADVAKLKFFLPPPGTARDALLKERWQVRKIMRSPALTVAEHESAQRAAEIMATNGIHA